MNLLVERQWLTKNSTLGNLLINGQRFCYTLEPAIRHDGKKPRAIPPGTYDVRIAWSPKHQRLIPVVENVPDFVGIEIHIGNYPHDTEGCLLVGKTKSADEVHESAEAFNELFLLLSRAHEQGEKISISYSSHETDPHVAQQ